MLHSRDELYYTVQYYITIKHYYDRLHLFNTHLDGYVVFIVIVYQTLNLALMSPKAKAELSQIAQ